MSGHDYEEDFEEYDEEFESDTELEVPEQKQQLLEQTLEPPSEQHQTPVIIAGLPASAWPTLSDSRKKLRPATFTRSLVSSDGAAAPAAAPLTAFPSDGVLVTVSPAALPLTDGQRQRAARRLQRSQLRKQQCCLSLSPQLQHLVMKPQSEAEQYSRGVGVYANIRVAACQTRQLHHDIQEQDAQTAEVEVQDASCQVPDDAWSTAAGRAVLGGNPTTSSSMFAVGLQRGMRTMTAGAAAATAHDAAAAAAIKLLDQDVELADFVEWAVPEMMLELSKAAAAGMAAAEGSRAAAAAQHGLLFQPCNLPPPTKSTAQAGAAGHVSTLAVAEMQLGRGSICSTDSGLLVGRSVVGIACPGSPATATAAAAAIMAASASAVAASGGTISSHLLLSCCNPVAMSAEAALKEHGLRGLGCLCIWDLAAQQPASQQLTEAGAMPPGLIQLLVSEGRPSCCCWGEGAGSCLVFAGMEEGGLCCWDLSEPDSLHTWQQQMGGPAAAAAAAGLKQLLPVRRPSYSTSGPLLAALADNSIVSVSSGPASFSAEAVVAVAVSCAAGGSNSSSSSSLPSSTTGGAVFKLISLTAGGSVAMHSVMWGPAGSVTQGSGAGNMGLAAAAVTDLGMRTGSRVWLVKTFDALPLGLEATKPLHQQRQQAYDSLPLKTSLGGRSSSSTASSLLLLPGPNQQLLVGVATGRVLKGACLGALPAPREYIAEAWTQPAAASQHWQPQPLDTANTSDNSSGITGGHGGRVLGDVLSLALNPADEALWLAGCSCGSVALFSSSRSRPVLLWQQLTRGVPVLAVRWVPGRAAVFLVLDASGCLLAFDLVTNTKQPVAAASLARASAVSGPVPAAAAAAAASKATSILELPCCMEVCVSSKRQTSMARGISSTSTSTSRDLQQQQRSTSRLQRGGAAGSLTGRHTDAEGSGAVVVVAVGYKDGTMCLYQLDPAMAAPPSKIEPQQEQVLLQQLVA